MAQRFLLLEMNECEDVLLSRKRSGLHKGSKQVSQENS